MREHQVVVIVEAHLAVGVFVINFNLTPKQDHRVFTERTNPPLPPIEGLILRPRKSFAALAVVIVQPAAANVPHCLSECEISKLSFQFVKPVDEHLNASRGLAYHDQPPQAY